MGLEWGAFPAGEGAELRVARALWGRWQAPETDWDGGGGASGADGAVALPGDGGLPSGGRTQSGVSGVAGLRQAAVLGLVEAARETSGPMQEPSERWGRLRQAFRLSSKDAERMR